MAVRVLEVAGRLCIKADCFRQRIGLSPDGLYRRRVGLTTWGETEIERCLEELHGIGRELLRLTRDDLVEPGTILRPADRQLLRLPKAQRRKK